MNFQKPPAKKQFLQDAFALTQPTARCGVRAAATQMWAPLRLCRGSFSAEIGGLPAATQTRWINGLCRGRKMGSKEGLLLPVLFNYE
jgi:hypothetical protein